MMSAVSLQALSPLPNANEQCLEKDLSVAAIWICFQNRALHSCFLFFYFQHSALATYHFNERQKECVFLTA